MGVTITDADGIDWPPIDPMPGRGKAPEPAAGHPFILEEMRPSWPTKDRPRCEEMIQIGDQVILCELAVEGRHDPGRIGWRQDRVEHHGHLEIPGKIWATVTWRTLSQ